MNVAIAVAVVVAIAVVVATIDKSLTCFIVNCSSVSFKIKIIFFSC